MYKICDLWIDGKTISIDTQTITAEELLQTIRSSTVLTGHPTLENVAFLCYYLDSASMLIDLQSIDTSIKNVKCMLSRDKPDWYWCFVSYVHSDTIPTNPDYDQHIGLPSGNAKVYKIRGIDAVAKILYSINSDDAKEEAKLQTLVHSIGLAPEVLDVRRTKILMKAKTLTVQELLQAYVLPSLLTYEVKLDILSLLQRSIISILKRIATSTRVCHNDPHLGNWMLDMTLEKLKVWQTMHKDLDTLKYANTYYNNLLDLHTLQLIDFGEAFICKDKQEALIKVQDDIQVVKRLIKELSPVIPEVVK